VATAPTFPRVAVVSAPVIGHNAGMNRLVASTLVVGALLCGCGTGVMTPDAGAPCSSAAKTPPNLAVNAEFECPDATRSFGTLDPVATIAPVDGRTGKALRFTTSSGVYGNRFSSTWKAKAPAAGTYCLTAWLKSTSTATVVRFYGGPAGQASGNMFAMPGPVTSWAKVPPNVKLDVSVRAGDDLFVEVAERTSTAGSVIDLDDLDLWASASGRCDEPR
jgi:hypothetical protein